VNSTGIADDNSRAQEKDALYSDRDFALALKMQEDENEKYAQRAIPSSKSEPFRVVPPKPTTTLFGSSICSGCNWPLVSGRIHSYGGRQYHAGCFKCSHCSNAIEGKFVLHGTPDELPYHTECADELFVPTCSICPEKLRGQFYRHPFFRESCYCVSHEGKIITYDLHMKFPCRK
jgi:LIM domain